MIDIVDIALQPFSRFVSLFDQEDVILMLRILLIHLICFWLLCQPLGQGSVIDMIQMFDIVDIALQPFSRFVSLSGRCDLNVADTADTLDLLLAALLASGSEKCN